MVATLVMATVPAERLAAAECFRVLEPGGLLLLLDHVRSPIAPARWIEWILDLLVASPHGFTLLRGPMDYVPNVGFEVERCDRTRGGSSKNSPRPSPPYRGREAA